jgi:hypothetical protein
LLLFMTLGMLLAIPAVALADDVYNNLDGSIDAAKENLNLTTGGTNDTASVLIQPRGSDGKPGCNLTGSSTLKVAVHSSDATKVAASLRDPNDPSQPKDTFTSCEDSIKIRVQALAATGQTPVDISLTQVSNDTGATFNLTPAAFTVTVTDPPPPADSTSPVITPNISGMLGNNGWYTSDVTLTWSVVDNESAISNSTGCGTINITSDQNATDYTCTATSAGGTSSETVTIKRDATAPTGVTGSLARPADHSGWYNAPVGYQFDGNGAISGIASCTSGTYNGQDGTGLTVSGSCTDNAGNESASVETAAFNYDATPPTNITFSGISNGDSFDFGNVPAQSSLGCSADDATSGFDSCSIVSGYGTSVGNHTLTAKAFDQAGNSATKSLSYEVVAWTLKGFYPPVDMGIHNTMKGGQTVPLKFEIFQTISGNELTDTSVLKTFTQKVNCTTSGGVDAIEDYATGSTTLRYDTTSGQFIFNWKTPKGPGTCYRVTMTTQDGSSISADFTLK